MSKNVKTRPRPASPERDRSGKGLPPKAERRALGKAAAAKRLRTAKRNEILRNVGSVAAVLIVVGFLAVGCIKLSESTNPQAAPTTPADQLPPDEPAPTVTIDPSFDEQLRTRPTVLGATGDITQLVKTLIVTGKGAPVQSGQQISVNYVGAYYNSGDVFDTSWGKQPATFSIGTGDVIAGWDQGLVGVPIGSRVQLDIPSALAYGPDAKAQGKPEGALRFVVDILAAK